MKLNYIITILDRNRRATQEELYKSLNLKFYQAMLGRGTATHELLSMRGLKPTEKVVMAVAADEEDTKKLIRATKLKLFIDIPGNGILMVIPIKSVGGAQTLAMMTGDKPANQEKPEMKFDYELIYVILNEGHSDEVMDAARPAGARGGTVIAAKGTGFQTEKFRDMSIASEKEVVLIVAQSSGKAEIMKAILEKAGPQTRAGAICFSLPVSQVAGLRQMEPEEEESPKSDAASPEQ